MNTSFPIAQPMAGPPGVVVRRRRRTLPLAAVLALSFGIVVVVGICTVLVIGIATSRTNTLDLLNDKSMLMVELMEAGVRGHLDPAAHQAAFIDRQVDLGVLDLNDQDELSTVLLGALAAAPQISTVVFWDTDLQATVARVVEDDRAVIDFVDDRDGQIGDAVDRARASPEGFWGDLIFEPNLQVTIITFIQPVWVDGSMAGILGIVLTMPVLSDFITEVGDRFDATGFILYGDQVLAHPNLTSAHPDLGVGQPTVQFNRIGDDVIANLPNSVPSDGFDEATAAGVTIEVVTIAWTGVEHVVISSTLKDYGDVPLTVAAHIPETLVGDEIDRLVWLFYAGAMVLLGSIIAALVVGRALSRPIRRAAERAIQVGSLDLAALEPMPASRVREFDDQARAFNRMLGALKWFETYVPRALVRRLVASGDDERLESTDRELSILFTDIVGFTALSEEMPAGEAATLLNEHFALLGGCVEAEDGTIDKYIGDALMAFWGAPDEQPDHAARACRAACAIAVAVTAENEKRRKRGLEPVRVRLGVHTGSVMVGNIGAPGRINYTIVGDAVNTAQRIESLGRELDEGDDVTVTISAVTAAAVKMNRFRIEPAGVFGVKGKAVPLEVFRLGHRVGAAAP